MARFTHSSIPFVHFSAVLMALLILNNYQTTWANPLADSSVSTNILLDASDDGDFPSAIYSKTNESPDSKAFLSRYPWSELIENARHNYFVVPKVRFNGLHRRPYQNALQAKRSIPIELQKALFAHGIVGRRR